MSKTRSPSDDRNQSTRREDGYRPFELLRTVLTIINFAANVGRWVHEIFG